MEKCLWTRYPDEYSYETECGEQYNPYDKSGFYPKIEEVGDDKICPYCGKVIDYWDIEEDEELEEDEYD